MPETDLFLVFTAPLETTQMQYMVSGSVASMIYGEPRLTNDIDIILHLDRDDADRLNALFPPEQFYCPPPEVIVIESRRKRRGHFNLIHHETGHKADIYLSGEDRLHEWAFARRRHLEIAPGQFLSVAPPEYVIVRKLQYFEEGSSEKHRTDIKGMLAVSGADLDRDALADWISQFALRDTWLAVAGEEP